MIIIFLIQVVIGGDGSLTGANLFRQEWPELVKELVDTGNLQQLIELLKQLKNVLFNYRCMTYHTGDQHTVYVSKLKHTKNNLNTFTGTLIIIYMIIDWLYPLDISNIPQIFLVLTGFLKPRRLTAWWERLCQ